MNELQRDNPETPEQQTVPVNDESTRLKYTTEAEVLLQMLRDGRLDGSSVYQGQICEEAGIYCPNRAFRQLRGQGFKIRYRLEWLDDQVELSYDLAFDPLFDVAC